VHSIVGANESNINRLLQSQETLPTCRQDSPSRAPRAAASDTESSNGA
jgi:hypothetical protein